MQTSQIIRAWAEILKGRRPSLSLEITRECPLNCPGCYAYDKSHLGGGQLLRDLNDLSGQALIDGVLEVVDRLKPLHLSIVGGDPLVRYRELELLIPQLLTRGIHIQVVTSAFRPIILEWANLPCLQIVVSIDGLQPEHDIRRAPATYARILKNIAGHQVTVHCTITRQMTERAGYLWEFMDFWSARPETEKIWFSMFTPQVGETSYEILPSQTRIQVIEELLEIREKYPKLSMTRLTIEGFRTPPSKPSECTFAKTTRSITADLKTAVSPCQFGGNPDCSQCGCLASAGLNSIGKVKVAGKIPLQWIYDESHKIGNFVAAMRGD